MATPAPPETPPPTLTVIRRGFDTDSFVKVMTVLNPILLAAVAAATVYFGRAATVAAVQAEEAAHVAEATRQDLKLTDSVQTEKLDSIHVVVNAQKSELELINFNLRAQLRSAGIRPQEDVRGQGKEQRGTTTPTPKEPAHKRTTADTFPAEGP